MESLTKESLAGDFERFARPATVTSKDDERSINDGFDPGQSNRSATTLIHRACMRKLRKNVHEKYTLFSLSPSHTYIFSLVLSLCFSFFRSHTDTHAQTRESKISLLPLALSSPMRETKFLETSRRISSKQLTKSRLKDGGELQRNDDTRIAACAF